MPTLTTFLSQIACREHSKMITDICSEPVSVHSITVGKLSLVGCKMASNGVSYQGLASTLENTQLRDHIRLAIRFSAHKSFIIDTSVNHTIRDVKRLVAERSGIPPCDIHLVLAGQQLEDNTPLQNCGIGSYTTLHAFCWSGKNSSKEVDKENVDKTSCTDQNLQLASGDRRQDTYVGDRFGRSHNHRAESFRLDRQDRGLDAREEGSSVDGAAAIAQVSGLRSRPCKVSQAGYRRFFVYCKVCEGIRPAKLRLVCKECGNGAFLVERGPANWDDISASTSITGRCTSEHCTCITPRFFFRCSETHEGDVDGTAVVLKHVNTNRRLVECISCGDVASHVLIFPCAPGHVTCLPCFCQYCSFCLSERRFTEHEHYGYTLPCPARCPDSHIEESHHFLLLGKEKYERYKNFGAEEYVLQNGGLLCPAPGCGMGLFPEDGARLVKCEECQFECCKDCRRQYHTGPCHSLESMAAYELHDMGITNEMAERGRWDRQSMSLIEETTKACPSCHTKTERSGGCMHMVCSRCSCEWCWMCVKPWTRECMAEHWFG